MSFGGSSTRVVASEVGGAANSGGADSAAGAGAGGWGGGEILGPSSELALDFLEEVVDLVDLATEGAFFEAATVGAGAVMRLIEGAAW